MNLNDAVRKAGKNMEKELGLKRLGCSYCGRGAFQWGVSSYFKRMDKGVKPGLIGVFLYNFGL